MPLDDLEDRLSSLDELWKTAKTDGPSGNWLPDDDGDYQGILVQVDFFEQKKEPVGKAWLKLIWELQETNADDRQYAGMQVSKLYDLEPQLVSGRVPASTEEVQQKLGFLKRDLKTLGIDVEAEDFSMGSRAPRLADLGRGPELPLRPGGQDLDQHRQGGQALSQPLRQCAPGRSADRRRPRRCARALGLAAG
jgi:hypothetical protein